MSTSPQGCYCGLWQTAPETLENQGLPRGYCGVCDSCGQPGHTRPHPAGLPISGAWCDVCFSRLLQTEQGVAVRLLRRLPLLLMGLLICAICFYLLDCR